MTKEELSRIEEPLRSILEKMQQEYIEDQERKRLEEEERIRLEKIEIERLKKEEIEKAIQKEAKAREHIEMLIKSRFKQRIRAGEIEVFDYNENLPFMANNETFPIIERFYPLGKYEITEVSVRIANNVQWLNILYSSTDRTFQISYKNINAFKWVTKDYKITSILDLKLNLNKIIDHKSHNHSNSRYNYIPQETIKLEYGIAKCINIIGYENHEIIKYPLNQYEGYTKYINDDSLSDDEKKIKIYKTSLIENPKPIYSSVILGQPLIAERDSKDLSYLLLKKASGQRI